MTLFLLARYTPRLLGRRLRRAWAALREFQVLL
jgi:hypothetical protein